MRYEAERENEPQRRPDGQGAAPMPPIPPVPENRGAGLRQEGQGTELRPEERGAGPGDPVGDPHQPNQSPVSGQSATAGTDGTESSTGRLLPQGEREKIGLRLQQTVNTFVDSPRRSVEEADSLLEETTRHLTETLAERRRSLRGTWADKDRHAETEELRVALRTYREMTERLLQL